MRTPLELVCCLALLFGAAVAASAVPRYGIHELVVANGHSYSNPFDFREIELVADFASPTGRRIRVIGFCDGDGRGSQNGNLWKVRFMPDEVGSASLGWWIGTHYTNGRHFDEAKRLYDFMSRFAWYTLRRATTWWTRGSLSAGRTIATSCTFPRAFRWRSISAARAAGSSRSGTTRGAEAMAARPASGRCGP